MSRRGELLLELTVALLLLAGAALLYLEWWRGGEFELLTRRVDELELRRRQQKERTTPAKPTKPATGGNE